MEKKFRLYIIFILLFSIVFIIIDNKMLKLSRSNDASYISSNDGNLFTFNNDYVIVSFNDLDKTLNGINDYLDYDDSLKNIYNKIIDSYYQKDKVKMYKEKNKQTLEIKLNNEESKSLFNKFYNGNKITIKVLFDKDTNIDDFDLQAVRLKLNKDEVVRENIVNTALSELNNTGEKFWKWYGFNHRVEWCCVFVSWVAYQNDVLNSKIPKFIWVKKGVDYYREKNQLKKPGNYKPKPGDIIFFDWNHNVVIDHVGIVEKVENGYVYTIEGNVQYKWVKEKKYKLNSPYIYAYGVPDYAN